MSSSDPFSALADPTRRQLLRLVAEQPRAVNELADRFSMSRPAVGKHLRILEGAGLLRFVSDPNDGRKRVARAELAALVEVDNYLEDLRRFWTGRLDRLGEVLDELD